MSLSGKQFYDDFVAKVTHGYAVCWPRAGATRVKGETALRLMLLTLGSGLGKTPWSNPRPLKGRTSQGMGNLHFF